MQYKEVQDLEIAANATWEAVSHSLGLVPDHIAVAQISGDAALEIGESGAQAPTDSLFYVRNQGTETITARVLIEYFYAQTGFPRRQDTSPYPLLVTYASGAGALGASLACTFISAASSDSFMPTGMDVTDLKDDAYNNADDTSSGIWVPDVGAPGSPLSANGQTIQAWGSDYPWKGQTNVKGTLQRAGGNTTYTDGEDANTYGWLVLQYLNTSGADWVVPQHEVTLNINQSGTGAPYVQLTAYMPAVTINNGQSLWVWVAAVGSTYPGLLYLDPLLNVAPLRAAVGTPIIAPSVVYSAGGTLANQLLTSSIVREMDPGVLSIVQGKQGIAGSVERDRGGFAICGFVSDEASVLPAAPVQFVLMGRARACQCDGTCLYPEEYTILEPYEFDAGNAGRVERVVMTTPAYLAGQPAALVTLPTTVQYGFSVRFVLPTDLMEAADKMLEVGFWRNGEDEPVLTAADAVYNIGLGTFLWTV